MAGKQHVDATAMWWFFPIAIWLPSVLGFPGGDGWEWMSAAAHLDGAQFMDFAYPLVEMSANAYRYPGPLHLTPGWSLSARIAPLHSPLGGAHALVFEEILSEAQMGFPLYTHNAPSADMGPHHQREIYPNSAHVGPAHTTENCSGSAQRVIVAFRGTQISSSIDSLADVCADKLLWEGFNLSSLPEECLVFEPHTLDYFSQALNYTLQVIDIYPSVPILLTGHSLGAGLAILVAGALLHTHTLPVIGFGAPATREALLDRDLSVKPLENGSILVIGHEWDVIMRTQMEGQVGSLCFYPQTESASCKACISSLSLPQGDVNTFSAHDMENIVMPTFKESASKSTRRSAPEGLAKVHHKDQGLAGLPAGNCMDCFLETHYLKNFITVVKQGEKPICQQARDVSLAQS